MENEKRLIEYGAVYQYAVDGVHGGGLEDEDFNAIINAIDAVPTVDAVEVVRCGSCKDWLEIEETGGAGYCNHPCWMIAGTEPPIVQFADFCSYGERRTEDQ